VAALVTWAVTFAVRRFAVRFNIIEMPDERRIHERPTPTIGGTAMLVGLLVAMLVASQLHGFRAVFRGNSEPIGVVVAGAVIFAVGIFDDVREMSAPAKMSGQVLAGTVLYLFGVTMLYFRVPFAGTTLVLSASLAPILTVLWVVGMANAVNFIDGLDGLAAGIVGIAALAFFLYSHQLLKSGVIYPDNSGPLVAVVVLGLCVGFLPHNFHPAKIFMGDAGAMLLGLLMAASTMSVVGQTDSGFSGRTYFTFAPIVIPFFILGIPMLDTAFAIIRRAGRRGNPAVADKNHLHHRLMRLGHGQTRAVLILWTWTALLSGLVLYPAFANHNISFVPIGVIALGVALYTLFAPRGRSGVASRTAAASGNEAPAVSDDGPGVPSVAEPAPERSGGGGPGGSRQAVARGRQAG
jgi:UDP-GlcNAc:undecaprenyl-phosphate GlcNAc-1-phosphate transferase